MLIEAYMFSFSFLFFDSVFLFLNLSISVNIIVQEKLHVLKEETFAISAKKSTETVMWAEQEKSDAS